jgi:23S rRNA A1618 N6-methylase RlmF
MARAECSLDFQVEVFLSDDRMARAAAPRGAYAGKRSELVCKSFLFVFLKTVFEKKKSCLQFLLWLWGLIHDSSNNISAVETSSSSSCGFLCQRTCSQRMRDQIKKRRFKFYL